MPKFTRGTVPVIMKLPTWAPCSPTCGRSGRT